VLFRRVKSLLDLAQRGAIARALHSRWLTKAVASPRQYPRIPIRQVSQGGFSDLTSTPEGRILCDGWWYLALDQVDAENAKD
jgi:hypothetical protein